MAGRKWDHWYPWRYQGGLSARAWLACFVTCTDRFLRFTSRATPAELLVASIAQESIRVPIQALSTDASARNCRTASETKDILHRIDLVEINQCLAHSLLLLSLLRENSSQGYRFLLLALQTSQLFHYGINYAAQSQTFSWPAEGKPF